MQLHGTVFKQERVNNKKLRRCCVVHADVVAVDFGSHFVLPHGHKHNMFSLNGRAGRRRRHRPVVVVVHVAVRAQQHDANDNYA